MIYFNLFFHDDKIIILSALDKSRYHVIARQLYEIHNYTRLANYLNEFGLKSVGNKIKKHIHID